MLTINAQTNSGSKIQIVTDAEISFLTIYGDKKYYDVNDGYVHLLDQEYTPDEIAAIKKLNTLSFAGKLPEIRTDMKSVEYKNLTVPLAKSQIIKSLLPRFTITGIFGDRSLKNLRINWKPAYTTTRMVDCLVPFELHLGGSWQSYYGNNDWLTEAEQIKGSRVYLA